MSKARISDVRQGVTLYYVHAFPHKVLKSRITPIFVTERPKRNDVGLFSKADFQGEDHLGLFIYNLPWSLKDAGIIENKANFHKTFTSMKAAKRYAARMDRVCLSAAERMKYNRKREGFMWSN